MKEIGGYFELELRKGAPFPHSRAVCVNSGRNALEFIIRSMETLPRMVWVPYYTCEVVIQPLRRLGIPFRYYHIDQDLRIKDIPDLGNNDYIIVNNYFGLLDNYIDRLTLDKTFARHIIIDDTQAWYDVERSGVSQFYSPRKFFGVPDGGIASTRISRPVDLEPSYSFDRCSHLLKRLDTGASSGYTDFTVNDKCIDDQRLLSMSNLTEAILSGIDYEWAKMRRLANFKQLHTALEARNRLAIPDASSYTCPMVYPFLTDDGELRERLIDSKIYVARYWPNVLESVQDKNIEYDLASNMIPIPIDQRYDQDDMDYIIKNIIG